MVETNKGIRGVNAPSFHSVAVGIADDTVSLSKPLSPLRSESPYCGAVAPCPWTVRRTLLRVSNLRHSRIYFWAMTSEKIINIYDKYLIPPMADERITKTDTKETLKKFSDYLENSTIIFPIISYCSEEKFIWRLIPLFWNIFASPLIISDCSAVRPTNDMVWDFSRPVM